MGKSFTGNDALSPAHLQCILMFACEHRSENLGAGRGHVVIS